MVDTLSAHSVSSYFSHFFFFCNNIADGKIDFWLIPEFDGSTSVSEWIEKVELVCV